MSDNKRRLERNEVYDGVQVRDIDEGALMGTLVNIHEEGFMLLAAAPLEENARFRVRFENEQEEPLFNEFILDAECLWKRDTEIQWVSWAGFQILHTEQLDKDILSKVIDELSAR